MKSHTIKLLDKTTAPTIAVPRFGSVSAWSSSKRARLRASADGSYYFFTPYEYNRPPRTLVFDRNLKLLYEVSGVLVTASADGAYFATVIYPNPVAVWQTQTGLQASIDNLDATTIPAHERWLTWCDEWPGVDENGSLPNPSIYTKDMFGRLHGKKITINCNRPGGRPRWLSNWQIMADGYSIVVNLYGEEVTGAYRIDLESGQELHHIWTHHHLDPATILPDPAHRRVLVTRQSAVGLYPTATHLTDKRHHRQYENHLFNGVAIAAHPWRSRLIAVDGWRPNPARNQSKFMMCLIDCNPSKPTRQLNISKADILHTVEIPPQDAGVFHPIRACIFHPDGRRVVCANSYLNTLTIHDISPALHKLKA